MGTHKILTIAAVIAGTGAFAQDDMPMIPEERLQEIKAQKVAYLTQKMDLTPEEAQKFWPVYNQYDKELEVLRKERREAHKALKDPGDMSEADAAAAIDRELLGQQKELDLRKKYVTEFKKVIGAKKTFKLHQAERDFNRELLKRMRERQQGGDGPGGGKPRR